MHAILYCTHRRQMIAVKTWMRLALNKDAWHKRMEANDDDDDEAKTFNIRNK